MTTEKTIQIISIVRLEGSEFSTVTDSTLTTWIDVVSPFVSEKQFGKLYPNAMAYLLMHKMKVAGLGENPLGELGKIGVGFGIGSVSEGGSSISFGAGQSSNLANDAELGLTKYGLQFLTLRRMCIVPIHISGELL